MSRELLGRQLLCGFALLSLTTSLLAIEGPDRSDLISIGLIVPQGKPEASEILRGAQLAVDSFREEASRIRLREIPSELQWGKQTTELTRSVYEEGIPILIGAPDFRTAHLVAQVIARSKGSVLFFSLSEDPTLTQLGVPWIYRLLPDPSDAPVATTTEAWRTVQDRYQKLYGTTPTDLSFAAYDAVRLAILLLLEHNDLTAIEQSLKDQTFEGLAGPFTFDRSGNRRP